MSVLTIFNSSEQSGPSQCHQWDDSPDLGWPIRSGGPPAYMETWQTLSQTTAKHHIRDLRQSVTPMLLCMSPNCLQHFITMLKSQWYKNGDHLKWNGSCTANMHLLLHETGSGMHYVWSPQLPRLRCEFQKINIAHNEASNYWKVSACRQPRACLTFLHLSNSSFRGGQTVGGFLMSHFS